MLTFLELVQQELGDGSVTKVTSPRTPPCAEEPAPDGAVVEELRGFLQERLPAYMVPSTFVLLDALPLTPNGKVDRRALPEPDMAGVEQEKTFVAPQTDLERTIASIWQEVLQVERVSVHDSFFDLGGNSVHVVQVYNKLRELMGEDLPIVKMFEYPTIHSLARYMVQGQDKRSFLQQERERARTRRELREQRRQTRRGRRATRDS